MPSDIEIAQAAKLQRISKIALEKLGIAEDHLEPYGHYKAKVSLKYLDSLKGKPDGKLILVTAMTPTPAGEGKTTTTVGLGDALNHIGKKAMICLREPSLGPVLRRQGRRRRRRLRAGRADGGHQPPFHRRLQRDRAREQPARGAARQPHQPRQRARHRHPPHPVEARGRHERPRAARHRRRARRHGERLSARGRLRHRGRLRGDGDLLPVDLGRGPEAAARQHRRRLHEGPETGDRARPEGARRDDGAAEGRARAEPGADAREQPGVRPRRAVREHRARLQLGDRDAVGAQARRLRA